jgi:hypothetical protein
MAWLALHTSQNIDPHATLAWWRDKNPRRAVALHLAKRLALIIPPQEIAVSHLEFFGVRENIEVAMLVDNDPLCMAVREAQILHESDWPIRPHVTAHNGRQVFYLSWLGLHLPTESFYWKLVPCE